MCYIKDVIILKQILYKVSSLFKIFFGCYTYKKIFLIDTYVDIQLILHD